LIGEYTGFLTALPKGDNKRTVATSVKTKYRHIIYDDPAITITIDSTHAGNELRFIADSKVLMLFLEHVFSIRHKTKLRMFTLFLFN
jgi:hypothetical protein